MKFSSLDEKKEKTYRVRSLDGGLNASQLACNIADGELSELENMDYRDGVLQTRCGLSAGEYDIIKNENEILFTDVSYTVTEAAAFVNGALKRLAYEKTFDGISNYIYYIYLLGADGSKQEAGTISFSRKTDDCFYIPYSMLFYSGAPIDGGGIFALVTAKNQYADDEYSYMVYEISDDYTYWFRSTSYYEPVIMINGRGNKYELAKASNQAYTAQPRYLEARNVLTSRFKAYFTSDGQSSSFRLPYSGLSDETVLCRIYTTLATYTEWVIFPGSTSATANFYTAKITMNVDRSKGIIYFTTANGEDYPVPIMSMYNENNIYVRAGKLFGEELKEICTLTCFARYGSKLIFSGGSESGKIYSVPYSNPLYFSEKCVTDIGGGGNAVTALLATKDGVLAFKKNEVHKVRLRNGAALNTSSLLANDDSVFYAGDGFTQAKLADIGCSNRRTCALCGSYPVWMSDDGKLYTMNSFSGKITRISEPAEQFLSRIGTYDIARATAVFEDGKYWLLLGDKALVLHFRGEKGEYKYYTRLFGNLKPIGILSSGGSRRFICVGSDERVLYFATETDICFDTDITSGMQANIENVRFSSSFSTKSFNFGSSAFKKTLQSIVLTAAAGGRLKIKLTGDTSEEFTVDISDSQYKCGALSVIRLLPHISAVRALGLELSCEDGMKIGEISFTYREA